MGFQVGWDKQPIQIKAKGLAMFGYGQPQHKAFAARSPLCARTVLIKNQLQHSIITCLDLGCITSAMRIEAMKRLQHFAWFNPDFWLLTATHTHSAPGGCSYEALYNMPTPGFVPEHLLAIVEAIVVSIENAYNIAEPTEIRISHARFDDDVPVAWNRSLVAYNRNPEVEQRDIKDTHLALDRQMQVLSFYRVEKVQALISLFGVHATCLGNQLHAHDGDNKGYAARFCEQQLTEQGVQNPVAIFAQATAGDVSPHFQGKHQFKVRKKISGEAEYRYAEQNGRYQAELALDSLQRAKMLSSDVLDAIYQHIDISAIAIDNEFNHGITDAKTSAPCHGVAFFEGVDTDGRGIAKPLGNVLRLLTKQARKRLLNPQSSQYDYYRQLFASQGNKDIFLFSGDKQVLGIPLKSALKIAPPFIDPLVTVMRQQAQQGALEHSQLVPTIVPIQLLKIGEMVLIACPSEITTISGKRLIDTVRQQLDTTVHYYSVISYSNDYMGYVTTFEEYQAQCYEAGHTLYGQFTLAALQTKFKQLAQQFSRPDSERHIDQSLKSNVPPAAELIKRTHPDSDLAAAAAIGR